MSAHVPQHFPTRRLPPNPSLEQLRHQAKDLLEGYRAGHPDTLAEVQQFEPAARSATFALHDAQRVLARAYGYASWARLKAFVDGANVSELASAVQAGNISRVRVLLNARPELVDIDMAASNEHRALHYAVLANDLPMVRLLMEAGADARKGIYPHRDATSALTIAIDREYREIVAVIEEEERRRREEMSCPNATVSPAQEQINQAILHADNDTAVRLLGADRTLIHACDLDGASPLHIAAHAGNMKMVKWLLERRASANKRDRHGWTPLDRAALAADPRNDGADVFPSIAKRLFDSSAELTLNGAVAGGNEKRVRELLAIDPGALRAIRQSGGLLSLAVNHRRLDMVRLLLDLGADVDERVCIAELEEPAMTWGMPLWYAALANHYDIAELLLDRGADPNANVYASGWPLRNAWNHPDESVKKLLLARGAKPQPYMLSEIHDTAGAKRLLEQDTSEELARELAWSAADYGCSAIVELALPRLHWPLDDARWHWVLIQPIRGAGPDSQRNEGHFASMAVLLRHGIDPNVARFGQTALHFASGYCGPVTDEDRARFALQLLGAGARLDLRDDVLQSTPLGWACRWGRLKLVKLLMTKGSLIEEPDAEPWAQPRAWARKTSNPDLVRLLGA